MITRSVKFSRKNSSIFISKDDKIVYNEIENLAKPGITLTNFIYKTSLGVLWMVCRQYWSWQPLVISKISLNSCKVVLNIYSVSTKQNDIRCIKFRNFVYLEKIFEKRIHFNSFDSFWESAANLFYSHMPQWIIRQRNSSSSSRGARSLVCPSCGDRPPSLSYPQRTAQKVFL